MSPVKGYQMSFIQKVILWGNKLGLKFLYMFESQAKHRLLNGWYICLFIYFSYQLKNASKVYFKTHSYVSQSETVSR